MYVNVANFTVHVGHSVEGRLQMEELHKSNLQDDFAVKWPAVRLPRGQDCPEFHYCKPEPAPTAQFPYVLVVWVNGNRDSLAGEGHHGRRRGGPMPGYKIKRIAAMQFNF